MPKYKIGGIDVHFPFEAYECQLVYMERVIEALQKGCNALLESPTGTGKTLCLLCATLAWRESLASMSDHSCLGGRQIGNSSSQFNFDSSLELTKPTLPTIVYSSRTHSQLQQVIRELKSSFYRPKMVVLGSREQMCIHRDVRTMRGKAQNNACRSLCKSHACPHQNRVSDYLKGHPELGDEPFDIEDLVSIGRTQGPCPYYLSRELHNSADILFAPYNYLIDKDNRRSLTGIHWANTVLIFDEAHNLENICADAASFDLPSSHLAACIAEAKQCIDLAHARRTAENAADTSLDPDNFAILKALLLKLEKRISEVPIQSEELGFTRPGPYIFEFFADLNITIETANMLIDTIDHATNLLEDEANLGSVTIQPKTKGTTCRLQALRDALKIIFRGVDHAASYRVHIHEPYRRNDENGSSKGKGSRTLSWWCFNPGIAMEEFAHLGVRSIILTSGTLAPLESFALELNLPFDVSLENPHVIDSNQIWVGVVSSGPSGRPLNSSYRTRDSVEYKQELGNTIVNFARIVPDGLLVFFPSYYLLNQCIEYWQTVSQGTSSNASTIWQRICKHKQPVVEPKQSGLFNHANEDFMAKLNDASSSGAVFFAVCRGKVSEGLDFADRAGRAVVVTGIPYAMKTDPKIRLKREFLDEQARLHTKNAKALTGEQWYVQQAARAINQAVGRVIRHRHDYGAIILCDERFAQSNTQSQMSLWLRPYIKCFPKFGDATFTLTRFFRDKVIANTFKQESRNNTSTDCELEAGLTSFLPCFKEKDVHLGDDTPPLKSNLLEFTQGQGNGRVPVDQPIHDIGIFGRKTITPLFPSHHPSSNMVSGMPQRSLSSMLAAGRGKALTIPLDMKAVAPANCTIGSVDGGSYVLRRKELNVPALNQNNQSKNNAKMGTPESVNCQTVHESSISSLGDKTSIADQFEPGASVKRLKMIANLEEKEASVKSVANTQVNSNSMLSGVKNPVMKVSERNNVCYFLKHPVQHNGKDPEKIINEDNMKLSSEEKLENSMKSSSEGSQSEHHHVPSSNLDTSRNMTVSCDDEKNKNAYNFLRQVRAKLSDPEYKAFMDCIKCLKQKTTNMSNVLETVASLFSAPERNFLFKRFGELIQPQYQQLFERHLNLLSARAHFEGKDK